MRHYNDLILLPTYSERLDYLSLKGSVGIETFGFDRYLNQYFYRSPEWKRIRDFVIVRDNGCDLGIDGLPIAGRIVVHHINPMSEEEIVAHSLDILNPDFLICTSIDTHNAIHYGRRSQEDFVIERTPFDTCPWKKKGVQNG